jgi:hypothetical protein
MNIEFFTPQGRVREGVINYVKEHLVKMCKQNKKISNAIVYFREQGDQKVCEVDLNICTDLILVQRSGDSYDEAARKVVQELTREIVQK